MSSIWSSAATQANASPFQTTGKVPAAGGGAATRYQSILKSSGNASAAAGKGTAAASTGSTLGATTAATAEDSTSDSGSAATITANDFLTLLVTEMQNQDPTSQQDPNEYINQLVSINSLEQLISINQDLTPAATTTSSTLPGKTTGLSSTAHPSPASAVAAARAPAVASAAASTGSAVSAAATRATSLAAGGKGTGEDGSGRFATSIRSRAPGSGSLTVPQEAASARAVGRALDGHATPIRNNHGIRDFPSQ